MNIIFNDETTFTLMSKNSTSNSLYVTLYTDDFNLIKSTITTEGNLNQIKIYSLDEGENENEEVFNNYNTVDLLKGIMAEDGRMFVELQLKCSAPDKVIDDLTNQNEALLAEIAALKAQLGE